MLLQELEDRAKVLAIEYFNVKKRLEDIEREMQTISTMQQTERMVLERIEQMAKESKKASPPETTEAP